MMEFNMLPAPCNGGFQMDGYWIWCGSVVKGEDNKYHMFASRWPKTLPMSPGWCLASEVVRAVSDTPEGPYRYEEVVLKRRGPQYWDGQMTHNPHIKKFNSTYVLYYTGSTYPSAQVQHSHELLDNDYRSLVARANQRVGIATSNSVRGPWTRHDKPILSTRPTSYDSFYSSNPAPCILEDGSVKLIYKTRSYIGDKSGPMTLALATTDTYTSLNYNRPLKAPLFSADNGEIEDPYIWYDSGMYHMIAKDMTGQLCGHKHSGIYATSTNALKWSVQIGKQSYSRHVLWDDGIIREMGSLERPFILFDDCGKASHMFFATANGEGGYTCATKTWNMVIPLKR